LAPERRHGDTAPEKGDKKRQKWRQNGASLSPKFFSAFASTSKKAIIRENPVFPFNKNRVKRRVFSAHTFLTLTMLKTS
jgi:hypothetical protein